jgi:hypothetical protein
MSTIALGAVSLVAFMLPLAAVASPASTVPPSSVVDEPVVDEPVVDEPVVDEPVVDEQGNVPLASTSVPPSTLPSAVTTVPVGCPPPPASQAVFVGMLAEKDATSATFGMIRQRSGSLAGYSSEVTGAAGQPATVVSVYYGRDVKFLDVGEEYLVGTRIDLSTGRLYSRVSEATELFGGNQIADIGKSGVTCPSFDDPARTMYVNGQGIESGIFSTLGGSSGRIALSVILPAGLVILGLIVLVFVRRLLTAGRSFR